MNEEWMNQWINLWCRLKIFDTSEWESFRISCHEVSVIQTWWVLRFEESPYVWKIIWFRQYYFILSMNAAKEKGNIQSASNRKPTINDRYRRDEKYSMEQSKDGQWDRIRTTLAADGGEAASSQKSPRSKINFLGRSEAELMKSADNEDPQVIMNY